MTEGKKATFKFLDYKISNFFYSSPDNEDEVLSIDFQPSGTYYQKKGEFVLNLKFIGKQDVENGAVKIELTSFATFLFKENMPFTDIPDFFYKNSIAIFFPYLRAFVSTVTLQANSKLIVLNVMNLTNLEEPFKQATKCVQD